MARTLEKDTDPNGPGFKNEPEPASAIDEPDDETPGNGLAVAPSKQSPKPKTTVQDLKEGQAALHVHSALISISAEERAEQERLRRREALLEWLVPTICFIVAARVISIYFLIYSHANAAKLTMPAYVGYLLGAYVATNAIGVVAGSLTSLFVLGTSFGRLATWPLKLLAMMTVPPACWALLVNLLLNQHVGESGGSGAAASLVVGEFIDIVVLYAALAYFFDIDHIERAVTVVSMSGIKFIILAMYFLQSSEMLAMMNKLKAEISARPSKANIQIDYEPDADPNARDRAATQATTLPLLFPTTGPLSRPAGSGTSGVTPPPIGGYAGQGGAGDVRPYGKSGTNIGAPGQPKSALDPDELDGNGGLLPPAVLPPPATQSSVPDGLLPGDDMTGEEGQEGAGSIIGALNQNQRSRNRSMRGPTISRHSPSGLVGRPGQPPRPQDAALADSMFSSGRRFSFHNEVQPALTALGCAAGGCHGSPTAAGGFRLSFRGSDDDADWQAITQQALGRRVSLNDPVDSLLLRKMTQAKEHPSKQTVDPASPEYRILLRWIEEGAPAAKAHEPRIESLEIYPPDAWMKPGQEWQATVLAHYSDHEVRDVTRWSRFSYADALVASIDETGMVRSNGPGMGAATAWFQGKTATATIVVPFVTGRRVAQPAPVRRNWVDREVDGLIDAVGLPTSPRSDDAEFLRRVYLDTIGVLPTPDEARSFLGDPARDKRKQLIDSLLSRPEFTDYWAYQWSQLLGVGKSLGAENARAYYGWVRAQVEADAPWPQTAQKLLTATGPTPADGSVNFFRGGAESPLQAAERSGRVFMGASLQCARCHNNPGDSEWTTDRLRTLADHFGMVRVKPDAAPGGYAVVLSHDRDALRSDASPILRQAWPGGPGAGRPGRRPAHGAGRMDDLRGQPRVLPRDCQSRLGALHGRRAGRARG